MPMRNCSKCLENNWSFEKIENIVRATCNVCDNEVEFEARAEIKKPLIFCRKCDVRLEKKFHGKKWKLKEGQTYYFEWWLKCPKCRRTFLQEEAKRYVQPVSIFPHRETNPLFISK